MSQESPGRAGRIAGTAAVPGVSRTGPLPPELEIVADAGLSREALAAALSDAPAGANALDALLSAGVIHEESFYQALARKIGCAYYLGSPRLAGDFDIAMGLRSGVAPLEPARDGARAVIAPRGETASRLIDLASSGRLRPESFTVTSPQRFAALVRAQRPRDVLRNALARLPDGLSARRGLTGRQIVALGLAAVLVVALGAANGQALAAIVSASLWLLFFAWIVMRAGAAVAKPDAADVPILSDDEAPAYTVVVALYKEGDVVRQLVSALNRLDYPASKLDIKLVVERRDRETIFRLLALDLPARYEVVVAPPGEPCTKPRALNLALAEARGELLAVYDAEDIPEPRQLRLAASHFAARPDVDCLQARLTVRNPDDSWLSRLFAVEYAVLFDFINPGLCALGLPIALGGTSNHFRVSALRAVGGWDEWNVAEDADLGIRLARGRHRVETLDSETSEEAPHEFRNWFRQRVRWQKGWMQTCIVHSRRPVLFVREIRPARAAAAALLIFGAVAGALLWPTCALATFWRAFGPGPAELSRLREAADLFVYLVACAGIAGLLIPAVVAARQRRLGVGIAGFALLPAYYLLVSLSAWTAIVDLAVRPHFWAKTEHGRQRRATLRAPPARVARSRLG